LPACAICAPFSYVDGPCVADGEPASGPTHAAYGMSVLGSIAMRDGLRRPMA
jgi:hypothetical protein